MKRIEIYDTTLRDGTQGEGVSFSADDKLKIARRLDDFGVDFIEGGWPGSNPKDVEFFDRIRDVALAHARVAAFGSTRRANVHVEDDLNLKALLGAGVEVATIFGKSWDFHVINALRTTLEENLKMIGDTVAYLKSHGIDVIYDAEHFFDGYKRDKAYALETLNAALDAGTETIVLCDTNGGTLPSEISAIVGDVRSRCDVTLGIHTHDDSGLGVANALVAVEAGAEHVQGTVNGFGERCGNGDLCQIIPNLQVKMGYQCVPESQLRSLAAVSRYVSELANVHPDDRQAFVGRSAFAHKGGIHVSAILKHPDTYEHMDPEVVGNARRVLVSELSGGSNVLYKVKEYGIDVESDTSMAKKVVNQIKHLEHQGYQFEAAEASFELLLKRVTGLYSPYFQLVGFRLISEKHRPDRETLAEATIKVKVGTRVLHTAAEGNGPVNALDAALRKALEEVYPALRDIKLTDYKVRVLNEKAGTEARVRVLIESSADGLSWGTIGVSTNIIEASWIALVDSIEYGLMKLGIDSQSDSEDTTVVPLELREAAN